MEEILFDMGADLNAETLTARLKESAGKRRAPRRRQSANAARVEDVRADGSLSGLVGAQSEFNQALAGTLALVAENLRKLGEGLAALEEEASLRDEREEAFKERTDKQFHQLLRVVEEIKERVDGLEERMRRAAGEPREREIEEIRTQLLDLERLVRRSMRAGETASAVSFKAKAKAAASGEEEKADADEKEVEGRVESGRTSPSAGLAASAVASSRPVREFDYFMFEQRFRGARSEIKRHQSAYVELFLGKERIVDLGCGRGEFVELLSERGLNATGVDNHPEMIEFCRERGLRVELADIFDYLRETPPASLDAIFVSQVVEHFGTERIVELVGLCAASLKAGGVLVAETINPHCPVALGNFYLDPSHVRPVPAELLRFICEENEFKAPLLRFSAPVFESNAPASLDVQGGLPVEAKLYQDYAVIAYKRGGEA